MTIGLRKFRGPISVGEPWLDRHPGADILVGVTGRRHIRNDENQGDDRPVSSAPHFSPRLPPLLWTLDPGPWTISREEMIGFFYTGYPAEVPAQKRKPLQEVLRWTS